MLKNLILGKIDWNMLLLGSEDWSFLAETSLRTLIMFCIIVIGLRLLGKRGVKQLSVFELVVIIGLGSAAGDPMFYKDVGILPALIVFIMVILLYNIIVYFVGKSKAFERFLEGKPVCLIKNGEFSIENFRKETLGEDEFFAELRMQSVSQLGQVEEAIEESSGGISIFFYPDEDVKYGLPVMSGIQDAAFTEITEPAYYSCVFCGHTQNLKPGAFRCPDCGKNKCVKASNKRRNR